MAIYICDVHQEQPDKLGSVLYQCCIRQHVTAFLQNVCAINILQHEQIVLVLRLQ